MVSKEIKQVQQQLPLKRKERTGPEEAKDKSLKTFANKCRRMRTEAREEGVVDQTYLCHQRRRRRKEEEENVYQT